MRGYSLILFAVTLALILILNYLNDSNSPLSEQEKKTAESFLIKKNEIDLRQNAETDQPFFTEQEIQIKKNLDLYRKFMEKCFIKHYESKQGKTQNGTLLVEFTVQKMGRLENIVFVEDPYQDQELTQCLTQVLNRVKIKKGIDKTKVLFPIEMKLPETHSSI